jgi:predicted NACHT family NTPase
MVEDWLLRDDGKHTISVNHKRRLMPQLAAKLWDEDKRVIQYEDLEAWLLGYISTQPDMSYRYQKDVELLVKDVHAASFLVRAGDSGFRFAHSSIHEYFLAEYLLASILDNQPDSWDLLEPSKETWLFLYQAIELEAKPQHCWHHLADWAKLPASKLTKLNRLVFANLASGQGQRIDWPDIDLSQLDLSERVFGLADPNATEPELPFTLNFENANLNGSRLRGSQWRGVNLQNATITQTQAQQSRWSGCNLQGADFEQSDLTASVFRGNLMIKAPAQLDLKNIQFLKNSPALSPIPAHQASLKWLISGHQDRINFCVYSPDGNTILTVSDDHTARLWNASNGSMIHSLEGHSGSVSHGAFSPDGNTILTVSDDHTARLWNACNGDFIHSLEGHSARIFHGAFSPDGNTILTVSDDHTVRLWNASRGHLIHSLEGHLESVFQGAFSPDGNTILTVSEDHTARLWNASNGDLTHSLEGHSAEVRHGAFSPDGNTVLTVSEDHTARLWNARNGDLIHSLEGHSGMVRHGAFSPDGNTILTLS